MAIDPNTLDQAANRYEDQASAYDTRLRESNSAYSPTIQPTRSDLTLDARRRAAQTKAETAASKAASLRWYGNTKPVDDSVGTGNDSMISRALNVLGAPLYSVVGATESVLGKGSKPGFLQNIAANVKERETFGNLLQKYNLPVAATMPLGFALDVLLDPVNWASGGLEATVPRIFQGVRKAGVEGGVEALRSSALKDASFFSKLPAVNRLFSESTKETLSSAALKSSGAYDQLIGRDIGAEIARGNLGKQIVNKLSVPVNNFLENNPKVANFVSLFTPKNKEWLAEALQKSRTGTNTVTAQGPEAERLLNEVFGPNGLPVETDIIGEAANNLDNMPTGAFKGSAARVRRDIAEGTSLTANPVRDIIEPASMDEFASRLGGEASLEAEKSDVVKNLEAIYKQMAEEAKLPEPTGIQWYDNLNEKAHMNQYAAKTLDAYDKFIHFFKTGAIGLNPAYYLLSVVSNSTMAGMSGINVSGIVDDVMKAYKFNRGKINVEWIQELTRNPDWKMFINSREPLFTETYGFTPNFLRSRQAIEARILQTSRTGENIGKTSEMVQKMANRGLEAGVPGMEKNFSEPLTILEMRGRDLSGLSADLFERGSPWSKQIQDIGERIKSGTEVSLPERALYKYATKPLEWAGGVDQAFKLGTAYKMTIKGVDSSELKALANWVDLKPSDYFFDAATKSYKIIPQKATELVSEIYMNYATIPAAIKMLRSVPIVGFPFASFGYNMTVKTMKGLAYNPAFFNKVQFMMNEFSGGKTPLEKKALQSPYYSWYTNDGMMRLPFFTDNPVYMNLANMLPYYTLNIFQDPQRFRDMQDKTLGAEALRIMDKTPFFKDPVGSLLMDYFIAPSIVRNAKGQFNQPIYPVDASPIEKAGYVLRAAADPLLPPVAAMGGIAAGTFTPGVTDYLPKYRLRAMSNAVQGKTPEGVLSKETPMEKTVRNVAGVLGIPYYRLKTKYAK